MSFDFFQQFYEKRVVISELPRPAGGVSKHPTM
jgi:hypothetical protein